MQPVSLAELLEGAISVERDDDHIHCVDGCEVFGEEFVEELPDLLHPDAEGYEILGQRMSQIVMGSTPIARALGAERAPQTGSAR